MKTFILAAAAVASLAAALPASAQIAGRQENQQDRIAQGERSGQLTGREANHLERQQNRIDRQEDRMRARDGGRLTGYDRTVLARRENRASRHIYRLKHNGRHW